MNKLALIVGLGVIGASNLASGDTSTNEMVTRVYHVSPGIFREEVTTSSGAPGTGPPKQADRDKLTQELFENAGVPFPAGSEITYDERNSIITMVNTVENHGLFKRILVDTGITPLQIETEISLIRLCDQTTLRQLRTNGVTDLLDRKATVLDRISVVTISGVQAQMTNWKSLRGLTPKEGAIKTESASPSVEKSENTQTNAQQTITMDDWRDKFGSQLNVTPSLGPDGYTMNITVFWEYRRLNGWTSVSDRLTGRLLPDVTEQSFTTSILIHDEQSIVLGTLQRAAKITSDRLQKDAQCPELIVLKARVLDLEGAPVHKKSDRP